ncbi:separin [Agrilus planipennis]|uniref:separase n=1 Tax=Agrilus planipennis TaxID=224129 RepID=A0A7F5RBW6_AGRPL|nr:separin [Agrilus planipennis]
MEENKTIQEILNCMQNIHFPCGLVYKNFNKLKALLCAENNELDRIYYLVESLTPALRLKSALRYERVTENENYEISSLPLNKANINFKCNTTNVMDNVQNLLKRIENLPSEWTLVQISSQLNIKERLETGLDMTYTNPLDIIVFNCGQTKIKPFCVTAAVPKDEVENKPIEICSEMCSIVKDIKNVTEKFLLSYKAGRFKNATATKTYNEMRSELDSRMKEVIKVVQDRWLGFWRCLLIGNYVSSEKEEEITKIVDDFLSEIKISVADKVRNILRYVIKGTSHLSVKELRDAMKYLFPGKEKLFYTKLVKKIKDFTESHYVGAFNSQKRHPVILIVEESLDVFPWEMLDIIQEHSVSRMPSFHFTYGLFKEHEDSIINGFKRNISCDKGTYVINPGLDLKKMEVRLTNYFKYWTPQWKTGIVGRAPSATEFEELLTSNDIFVYSGHGSGSQYLPGDKIQRLRVNGVVFLFGCSSVKLQSLGPQVEMHSSFQMYLIACSPCVVGALWEVTDTDTDILCADFLSLWIPSEAPHHWKQIDQRRWERGETVVPNEQKNVPKYFTKHEPELLKALSMSRKAPKYFTTKASFVVRGLPVKIATHSKKENCTT